MSTVWQVQQAKNHLSEVIDRALTEGPQTITRHGKPVARVVAVGGGQAEPRADDGFLEFLFSMPKVEGFAELVNERTSIKQIDPLGERAP